MSSELPKVPDVTKAQIDALRKLFPERSADPSMSRDMTMFEGGQISVVRFLNAQHLLSTQGG